MFNQNDNTITVNAIEHLDAISETNNANVDTNTNSNANTDVNANQ